jgi:hypothetical protein
VTTRIAPATVRAFGSTEPIALNISLAVVVSAEVRAEVTVSTVVPVSESITIPSIDFLLSYQLETQRAKASTNLFIKSVTTPMKRPSTKPDNKIVPFKE